MYNSNKTTFPNVAEIKHKCYVIDAENQILGKVATKAATILRGKHTPLYTPHLDTGDMVIVINAKKVQVTGNKRQHKIYQRYSGYPSGQRTLTFEKLLEKKPEKIIELAVYRMIPSGPLGNMARKKLRVYAGAEHPHQAQQPVPVTI